MNFKLETGFIYIFQVITLVMLFIFIMIENELLKNLYYFFFVKFYLYQ